MFKCRDLKLHLLMGGVTQHLQTCVIITKAKVPYLFFNDTATTEIYTLSLHDALPISEAGLDHMVCADLGDWD